MQDLNKIKIKWIKVDRSITEAKIPHTFGKILEQLAFLV